MLHTQHQKLQSHRQNGLMFLWTYSINKMTMNEYWSCVSGCASNIIISATTQKKLKNTFLLFCLKIMTYLSHTSEMCNNDWANYYTQTISVMCCRAWLHIRYDCTSAQTTENSKWQFKSQPYSYNNVKSCFAANVGTDCATRTCVVYFIYKKKF